MKQVSNEELKKIIKDLQEIKTLLVSRIEDHELKIIENKINEA